MCVSICLHPFTKAWYSVRPTFGIWTMSNAVIFTFCAYSPMVHRPFQEPVEISREYRDARARIWNSVSSFCWAKRFGCFVLECAVNALFAIPVRLCPNPVNTVAHEAAEIGIATRLFHVVLECFPKSTTCGAYCWSASGRTPSNAMTSTRRRTGVEEDI